MAQKSLLYDYQARQGATFTERDGWLVVQHFGDTKAEYESVRSAAGVIDLCNQAMLQFTGSDRLSYLQGMLTNDLRQLKMFEGQQAAILTQQGKIIAVVRVLCAMSSFYLDFYAPLKSSILAHLNRYLVADDVEIHDPNEAWKMLSLQGPNAKMILDALVGPADIPAALDHHAMVSVDGSPVCVVRADRTGYGGYDLIAKAEENLALTQRLNRLGAVNIGAAAANILRVEAGIPRHGIDYQEDHLFLELDLPSSVSFNKGCYLGQEIVERIRSRGHVNKKLCALVIEGDKPPNAGARVQADGKDVGQITSAEFSPVQQRVVALAYVNKDSWTPATRLIVRQDNVEIPCTVVTRPTMK